MERQVPVLCGDRFQRLGPWSSTAAVGWLVETSYPVPELQEHVVAFWATFDGCRCILYSILPSLTIYVDLRSSYIMFLFELISTHTNLLA